MSKKVYVIKNNSEKEYFKLNLTQFIVGLIVYACIIVISSNLFENMYVESFGYALLASFIISMLNYAVKPFLVFLTMPLSILTFGISYPIVNVIVLKLCGFLMGDAFNITGIFAPFIIAIFISFMKILFDNLITNRIGDGR
ncbi:MAG: phage holin family protein [Bacilli bacterium]|nr:phage holin family protein [Bacilli bacterium]